MDSNHATTDQNRVVIFDTTLRDGEQSPGQSTRGSGRGRD